MSPLQFEQRHAAEWAALEAALDALENRNKGADAAAAARGYRRVCEQLAVARSRAYPLHLAERLDTLAQRAHRLLYRERPAFGEGLRRLLLVSFPRTLRAEWKLVWLATVAFVGPLVAAYAATRWDPAFALGVMDTRTLSNFDSMYGDGTDAIGRLRDAETDWQMFGFYIRNNISVAFQCFATGLTAGIGSLFFLVYNGLLAGAVAGYLDTRGLGHNFWPFVATHAAFELTAIVISGAAGLMLGRALLAPGRLTRGEALREAGRGAAVRIAGAALMLVVAAVLEAFWSSAAWVPPAAKFGVAALCWAGVLGFLWRAGRGSGDAR